MTAHHSTGTYHLWWPIHLSLVERIMSQWLCDYVSRHLSWLQDLAVVAPPRLSSLLSSGTPPAILKGWRIKEGVLLVLRFWLLVRIGETRRCTGLRLRFCVFLELSSGVLDDENNCSMEYFHLYFCSEHEFFVSVSLFSAVRMFMIHWNPIYILDFHFLYDSFKYEFGILYIDRHCFIYLESMRNVSVSYYQDSRWLYFFPASRLRCFTVGLGIGRFMKKECRCRKWFKSSVWFHAGDESAER